MNDKMMIKAGDKLKYSIRRDDDGHNNGSIFVEPYEGHAYCIAKAPKYATDEEWKHNAKIIIAAVLSYNDKDCHK
jgi:hypothetical protein